LLNGGTGFSACAKRWHGLTVSVDASADVGRREKSCSTKKTAREALMPRRSDFIESPRGELPEGLRARSFAWAQENQLYFARAYTTTAATIVMPPRSDDETLEACTRREQVRRPRVPMR
jgi:hypothetical protein